MARYGVECFTDVNGGESGTQWRGCIESISNGLGEVGQVCSGAVRCVEAMLVIGVWDRMHHAFLSEKKRER